MTITALVKENMIQASWLRAPRMTRARMRAALIIAIAADVMQWCLGPFGWAGGDQVIDIAAMLLTMWLLGFHPLLLPTALLEFFPVIDWLPTWTGCVLLVIARRKHREAQANEPAPVIVNPPPMLPPVGMTNDEAPMTKE
jgi:hypothetical protein